MIPAERLTKLFDYDAWANRTILDTLNEHPVFDRSEKSHALFYHILGTQHHWYQRVTGHTLPNAEIWPDFKPADCSTLIEANHLRWTGLIEEHQEALDKMISYQNSQGVSHESDLSDILQHIIIHGQHHRSQIALLLRSSDIPPPSTDYIFYTRM